MTYKVVSLWLPSFTVTMQELTDQFNDKVQASIDRGFRPTGGVETVTFNGNIHLLQAMVREDEDELRLLSKGFNGETGPKTEVRAIGTGDGGSTGTHTPENAGTPIDGVCGNRVRQEKGTTCTTASVSGLQGKKGGPGSRKA